MNPLVSKIVDPYFLKMPAGGSDWTNYREQESETQEAEASAFRIGLSGEFLQSRMLASS